MARADTQTLMAIDDYAKAMGISPMFFNGGIVNIDGKPFSLSNAQNQLWTQFEWQSPSLVSRETLGEEIHRAEVDISNFIGYSIAPTWASEEKHTYPAPYRAEFYGSGFDARGQMKGIQLNKGNLLSPGRRATTLLENATVVYSDPLSDGWNTIATITVATTLTDANEIKVYFEDNNADPIWEIRPPKSIAISGGNVVLVFDSWLFFKPDLVNAIPTDSSQAINAASTASYVVSVDVYREYNDITQASAQFLWEREPDSLFPLSLSCSSCNNTGCIACSLISQDGCFQIRDPRLGIGAAVPATYDATDERWEKTLWTECREPDRINFWYKSGLVSERFKQGLTHDPLDEFDKKMISILATSRLICRPKTNNNLVAMIDFYQRDVSEGIEGSSIFSNDYILNNPFGTRRGEDRVFRHYSKLADRIYPSAAIVA